MSRPVGSKNKKHKKPRKSIAVRLTDIEVAKLKTIHPTSASKAIHQMIADHH